MQPLKALTSDVSKTIGGISLPDPHTQPWLSLVSWTGAAASALWANVPPIWGALAALMVLDILTGMAAGKKCNGKISSYKFTYGVLKKFMIWMFIAACMIFGWLAEQTGQLAVDVSGIAGSGSAALFSVGEFISIFENCHRYGMWVPGPILKLITEARQAVNYGGPEKRVEEDRRQLADRRINLVPFESERRKIQRRKASRRSESK